MIHSFSIIRTIRTTINALMIAALFGGLLASLIPPPLINGVTTQLADGAGLQADVMPIEVLARALPAPNSAHAAPIESVGAASIQKPAAAPSLAPPVAPALQTVGVCDGGSDDLGGTVFRDFNSNGTQDGGELGFDGTNNGPITVTAYGNDDNTGTTVTVQADGTYNFDDIFTNNPHIRLEFSGLLDGIESGVAGTNSGTTVQIHKAASCAADLALQNPAEYCESNPLVGASCFIYGDPLAAGTDASGLDAFVLFNYEDTGILTPTHAANTEEVGSVWGLAHQRSTQTLYTSATIKRFVGLGPLGIDGLYTIDISTPGAPVANSSYLDLNTLGINTGTEPRDGSAANSISASITDMDVYDAAAFDLVGKAGIGDIDMQNDSTLWLVNLADRSLYGLPNISPNAAPTSVLGPYALPATGCTSGEGDVRPWGLKVHDDKVYMGAVCSGESTQDNGALHGYIFVLDTNNLGGGLQSFYDFPLTYERGRLGYFPSSPGAEAGDWRAWALAANWYALQPRVQIYAQPILTDIEFDSDGSLIIGLADRHGLQARGSTYGPDPTATNTTREHIEPIAPGDILRFCYQGSGAYIMEGNPGCAHNEIERYGQTGFGEYYFGDWGAGFSNQFGETSLGSLLVVPGRDDVMMTSFDPLGFHEGGVVTLDNTTGDASNRARLYEGHDSGPTAGKGLGLGDLEAFCSTAPLEIGNYVWLDVDGDGVQDPCEEPVPGVQVSLYNITGTLVATTTTDIDGEYYFNDGNVNQNGATGLEPQSSYTITIGLNQNVTASGTSYLLSDLTASPVQGGAGSQATNDHHDSDGVLNGGVVETVAVTGAAGHNDHSFDFGFVPPTGTPMIQVDKQFNGVGDYRVGEIISFTIRITNTGDVIIDTLPLEDRYSHAFITYQSANPPPTPGSVADGIITWDDVLTSVSDTDGLGLGESVSVVVTFTAAADTTLLTAVAPCTQPSHASNLARSVGATAGASTVMQDADDTSCDSVQILKPTGILLAERSISLAPDGVLVRWTTVRENDTVGFRIWKSSGVDIELRSGEIIVAESTGQSSGATYAWLDAGATLSRGDVYVLEIVNNDGTTEHTVIGVMTGGPIFLPLIAK